MEKFSELAGMKTSCEEVWEISEYERKKFRGGGIGWLRTAEIMKRKKHIEKGSLGAIG